MVEYKCKSAIIGKAGKKNTEEAYPVFVSLFDINDPHKTAEVPKKILNFDEVHKIELQEFKLVEYLLVGKDIVLNNLTSISAEKDKHGHLYIKGKQK